MGEEVGAGCEVELWKIGVSWWFGREERERYEARVLETLDDFCGEGAGDLEVAGLC